MPTRSTTVRFGEELWTLLERAAAQDGSTAAQYVRDAAVLRLAFGLAAQDDPRATVTLAEVAARSAGRGAPTGPDADPTGLRDALHDPGRRAAVRRTGLLTAASDGPADTEPFDRLTSIAARALGAPAALVTLVDADRQVFAGCTGMPEPWASTRETPISHSFCQHAVASREPLVIGDVRADARVRDNPAVADLAIGAYVGIPLIDGDGHALGALCVTDDAPREWSADQVALLEDLATTVVRELATQAAPPASAAAGG